MLNKILIIANYKHFELIIQKPFFIYFYSRVIFYMFQQFLEV